ncbi:MAG: S-adenosylmethionine:tRNA ribosyltransferase-isomerase [Bacteroidales bacterium]|nr:S-adenosylmethionine:tRNA ribosyltransferase-isomerase [Bacteroidales bacterium]
MINTKSIRIEDFDYPLPDERIARYPLDDRESCRLLVRDKSGAISDHYFRDIVELLPKNSMLVYNNTRVINARLRFRKGENHDGAVIEIFCLDPVEPADYACNFAANSHCSWTCFVGNSKRWKDGGLSMITRIGDENVTLRAKRLNKGDNSSIVEFSWDNQRVTFSEIIKEVGEIPIPPYLNRSTEKSDLTDYQTVYSRIDGSVAAPTAGLHFTDRLLEKISESGIERRELTLHVGAGTFQPVKSEDIGDHQMHDEFIAVSRSLIEELAVTDREVVAVGTTSVRTLESLYQIGCLISEGKFDGDVPQWYAYETTHPKLSRKESLAIVSRYMAENKIETLTASTRIIIAPGYDYKVVDGMITNFHQPKSTLLLLVSAFIGDDWLKMYKYALENDFRFLSYGDANLFMR